MSFLSSYTPAFILLASALAFLMGRARAITLSRGNLAALHSRPNSHGLHLLLVVFLSAAVLYLAILVIGASWIDHAMLGKISETFPDQEVIVWQQILSDAKSIALGNIASQTDAMREALAQDFARQMTRLDIIKFLSPLVIALSLGSYYYSKISLERRARNHSEAIIKGLLFFCALIAVLTTLGIILSLIFETSSFFSKLGWRVDKFLFGVNWSPLQGVHDGAINPDRVGALPLFLGTIVVTLIAMCVSVPVGLFAAIYLADFASQKTRSIVKPMMEILAGIPTVVYGFFAAITIAPSIRGFGEWMGLDVASESALAAGLVMGIMIIPFISSLSDDVINAVPQTLRDGSYGLGATKAETIQKVVLPAALPGIVSAVLLGISRAVGETMIVVMAAGQNPNLSINPLEAVTTVTVQIVTLVFGDTDASTAAGPAFTLGFTLFLVTLGLNIIALRTVRKYRELYD